MATKIYNAVSGTGQCNMWTAGGATVGDDQSAEGGTASTTTEQWKLLSVPHATEVIVPSLGHIVSVTLTCRLKKTAGNPEGRLSILLYYGPELWYDRYDTTTYVLTTSYVEYSWVMTVNPFTEGLWTWDQFNSSNCGFTTDIAGTVYADHTYLTVEYTPFDLGYKANFLSMR